MLDASLSPEWVYRFYIRDGPGNDYFIVYTSDGAFIKGLDHESPMAPGRARPSRLWPDLVDAVPEVFAEFRDRTCARRSRWPVQRNLLYLASTP